MPYKALGRWPNVGEHVTFPQTTEKPYLVKGRVLKVDAQDDEHGERSILVSEKRGQAWAVARVDEVLIHEGAIEDATEA